MKDPYSSELQEYVYFSYQRLGDFFMAEELMSDITSIEELRKKFKSDSRFLKIVDEYDLSYQGVFETLTFLLPERLSIEIFELIDFFIEDDEEETSVFNNNQTYEFFTSILLDSFKWRSLENFDDKKIITWLKENFHGTQDDWFYTLVELCAISEHPFNSDRLYDILNRYSMPERDSFWQRFLWYFNGFDDNNNPFPLRRLISWAWTPDISSQVDDETARLVGQTLVWVLASINIPLRDQTTKSLVNLLEQKSNILILLLDKFKNVDDLYISERLYAIAYGCILRTEETDSIKNIANCVYEIIFKGKNPPNHILLRDYARNIIEYALHRNVGLVVDTSLIRPPYNSSVPKLPQEKNEVIKYKLDYDSEEYKKKNGAEQNAIFNSVVDGLADFGNKIVDPVIRRICSIPINNIDKIEQFYQELETDTKRVVDLLINLEKGIDTLNKRIERNTSKDGNTIDEKVLKLNKKGSKELKEILYQDLDKRKADFIIKSLLPYYKNNQLYEGTLDPWPIRYWIVQRVFELGYDKELHGAFDDSIRNFYPYNRYDNKIERIGKKYQWIAFYDIISRLTDNYKIKESFGLDKEGKTYKGAWQFYLRNIDSSYLKKNKEIEKEKNESQAWYANEKYENWYSPDSAWVNSLDDLVSPKDVIQKVDLNGDKWLYLQRFVDWEEPKEFGEDDYMRKQRRVLYIIQGLIVKKENKDSIVDYLKNKNFFGRWLPENSDEHSMLFNREKYWSPAYKDTYRDRDSWQYIRDTDYSVMPATESGKGLIDNDKSEANMTFLIPCQYLFEGMKLKYSLVDGNLENIKGESIVVNYNRRGCLIRQNALIEFFGEKGLDIIWTVLGEKYSHSNDSKTVSYYKAPCGVYHIEDGELKGKLTMFDRN